jgi:hypothetical protein
VVFGPGFHLKNWATTLFLFSSSNKNSDKAFVVPSKKTTVTLFCYMVMRVFWNMNLTVLFSLFVCAFAVADWQQLQTYQLKIGCLTWLQLLWPLQLHRLGGRPSARGSHTSGVWGRE